MLNGVVLLVDYPPTANHMKIPVAMKAGKDKWIGRMILAPKGRDYYKAVGEAFADFGEPLVPPYKVYIEVHVPDLRKRDLPNVEKASIDALDKAGIIEDDSKINRIEIVRFPPLRPSGILVVRIEEADAEEPVQSICGENLPILGCP